jgi:hypothetical protein
LISTAGRGQLDWSADYKLYSNNRLDSEAVFRTILDSIIEHQADQKPLVVAMDDTILRKTGRKIPTAKYFRDPLGAPFQISFVRAQRFLQISAAVKQEDNSARMIPIAFENAPVAIKPRRKASPEQWEQYRRERKQKNLSTFGSTCIQKVHSALQGKRDLWVTVDGSYTNRNVLRNLPPQVTLIGRIRSDARLYTMPQVRPGVGRKKTYGALAPTPEQVRTNDEIPWAKVTAFAAGKTHEFKIKTISGLRWRTAGKTSPLRLLVIAPLAYRLSKSTPLLYRNPAYLIATDDTVSVQDILQAYLWRWGIEVNFRDEKTLLGVGQAQVRNENSVTSVPQMMVSGYASLLLAGVMASQKHDLVPWRPKWYQKNQTSRLTTADYVRLLRCDLWGRALNQSNFSDFANSNQWQSKPEKFNFPLQSAVLCASG